MLQQTARPTMGADTAPTVVSSKALYDYDNDDLTLLQRVSAQDEQAFARLYDRYAPALRRSLSRTVGQACLVDEVLDDVMLILWQDAGQFPTTVPLGAWLHGIARNKAYKALRRQESAASLPAGPEPAPYTADGPEVLLLQHEQETWLSQTLASMPPLDHLFLEKFVYQGCSYQEIAAQTGLPLNTVKARIARARRRLVARCSALNVEAEAAA